MSREIRNMRIPLSDDDLCQVNGGTGLETLPKTGEAVPPNTLEQLPVAVQNILRTMQGQIEPSAQGTDPASQDRNNGHPV